MRLLVRVMGVIFFVSIAAPWLTLNCLAQDEGELTTLEEVKTEFAIVDLEVGTMLDRFFGTKGHSAYIRPSIGVGGERPTEGSIEIGYKIVW